LTTTAGTDYVLNFYIRVDNRVNLSNELVVNWNGTDVLNLTNLPTQPYAMYTLDVSATLAATPLTFSGLNPPDVTFLDDVSVEATNVVPEPSTWLLGLAGFGVLAVQRFRWR
jgi:hypothetical protein